jgi:hypothetical protein
MATLVLRKLQASGPTYPQWKNLIEEAERWAYGHQIKRQADAVTFLRFVVDKVNETKLLL